jgi:zinc transport system permease protein
MFDLISGQVFIVGIVIGASAALLGVFVILRRMALISDALSHVALPGMAIAIVLGFNPFIGAVALLAAAILGVFWIGRKVSLATETIIGVFFTTALAIGLLLIPREDLLEALFGDISQLTFANAMTALVGGGLIAVLILIFFRDFAKVTFSSDLALSEGIAVNQINLLFLFLLAGTVALGIKAIGTLLMGALIIIPAAAAKNLSSGLRMMTILSLIIGVSSVLVGFLLSKFFGLPPGPAVVLVGSVFFIISLIFRK